MAKNECGDEVPTEVASAATQIGCGGGVKYVYRDGQYGGIRPAASIGCKRATRFGSDSYKYFKVSVADGWVAFKSWSNDRPPAIAGLNPPLLSSIGEVTITEKIDGSPLVFRVEDEVVFLAADSPKKAFRVQLLRMWDDTGFDNGLPEYRICYYMIAHRPRMKDKWAFGQFAPMFSPDDLATLLKVIQEKGWPLPAAPAGPAPAVLTGTAPDEGGATLAQEATRPPTTESRREPGSLQPGQKGRSS
jgi:hypothetical protein